MKWSEAIVRGRQGGVSQPLLDIGVDACQQGVLRCGGKVSLAVVQALRQGRGDQVQEGRPEPRAGGGADLVEVVEQLNGHRGDQRPGALVAWNPCRIAPALPTALTRSPSPPVDVERAGPRRQRPDRLLGVVHGVPALVHCHGPWQRRQV